MNKPRFSKRFQLKTPGSPHREPSSLVIPSARVNPPGGNRGGIHIPLKWSTPELFRFAPETAGARYADFAAATPRNTNPKRKRGKR
jgi:hypothetical protein